MMHGQNKGDAWMMLACYWLHPGVGPLRPRSRGREMLPPPGEVDDGFLADEDITSRSLFPESWLWQVEQLTEQPNELG